ncbi:protein-disulfide reductase DsbD family protein [Cellvibrio sp. UBA7661]|uniref:protein-disulfide reductase DsbD family protein n=1 Tax=Cellvibrio sp. UBA7661 TaxID=1946311 RepID=UPI002F350073
MKKMAVAVFTLLLVFSLAAQSQQDANVVADAAITDVAVSDKASTPQVQAQIVASVAAVVPGSEIYLGINQQIIPHWHTYWVNPGDSGNATTIEWTLPEGASASDIIWPAPSRFSMGPITNYAYENNVTLLSKITIPHALAVGDTFTVRALVDWLVCEEECIPQQVELALSLPVVATQAETGGGSELIAEAQARLPIPVPWDVTAKQSVINSETGQGTLALHIALPAEQLAQVQDIWFYPYDWGRIRQSDPQVRTDLADGIQLNIPTGEAPASIGDQLAGVLVIKEQQGIARGYEIKAPLQALANNQPQSELAISFAGALLFALLGGIILNLMPCVFPVLSIKALSLVSHSHYSAQQIRRQGYVYTLGVLASFAVLALLLILLKAGGSQIGWGFQFQSPIFVLVVAYLLFAVGLSLSGVFFIGGSVAGVGSSLTEKPGYSGSFFTGVLATVVATPCTAPFMAAALGYAVAQPPVKLMAIFLSLGLGLALPYLLLSCWPRLQHWLPRPGLWMERAKQLLAFPMYAAAIWLVWVLVQQAGVNAVIVALGGMLLIALAAWLYDSTRTASNRNRALGSAVALLLVLSALGAGIFAVNAPVASNTSGKNAVAADANWEAFSDARLQELLAEGKPVFLNFTASWCISCLVNERVALSSDSVKQHFDKEGIVYLKGDWTNKDPEITAFLQKFNRSGVPLYVFYPAGQANQPIELPQILTPDLVIEKLKGE